MTDAELFELAALMLIHSEPLSPDAKTPTATRTMTPIEFCEMYPPHSEEDETVSFYLGGDLVQLVKL